MARAELEAALRGTDSAVRVRKLLAAELARSRAELAKPRSGYDEPVTVAFAPGAAVVPVDPAYRADPGALNERELRLVAAVGSALREAGGELLAGAYEGQLGLVHSGDHELAVLLFDDAVAGIDRLRAAALLVPALEVQDPRPLAHARDDDTIRPHDDPDPARRAARRILQRLDGFGKWGGYHTEFTHLTRGFEDRRLANEVGEALVRAGLLTEKPSVGQRHVALNPRRAGEIRRLIEAGDVPDDLTLPFT